MEGNTQSGTAGFSPIFDMVMVDIETLATHSSRAVILSVAFVPFFLDAEGPVMGSPWMTLVDVTSQLLDGRQIEEGTLDFWRKQDEAAREHFLTEDPATRRLYPDQLAGALSGALSIARLQPDFTVWSQGSVFDFGNLENLMREAGDPLPWRYDQVRDLRTLRRCLPKVREAAFVIHRPDYVPHDPVFDCFKQIDALWERAPASMLDHAAPPPGALAA